MLEVFYMKATGIVRKVDELGRIVIPIELRRILDIEVKDELEIFTEKDQIVLKKFTSRKKCAVTGKETDNPISLFDGKITVSPEGAEMLMSELKASHTNV